MRILAFSSLFGQFTPIALSNMKPKARAAVYKKIESLRQRSSHTFVQVGIGELSPHFFDDLDVIEVRRTLRKTCKYSGK